MREGEHNARMGHCNLSKERLYSSLMPGAKHIKDTPVNRFFCFVPSHIWTADYFNEKECRSVAMKTYSRGYPQCQSDRLIDRLSTWSTRYGNGLDLGHAGLLSQRTNGVGTKLRSAVCRYPTLTNQK
ncbi:hypothetical protein TNCV_1889451 [Trichonephila clavipes]|nr:hypothetical protein TNCV_1889451 [Trichonephila clavipes]